MLMRKSILLERTGLNWLGASECKTRVGWGYKQRPGSTKEDRYFVFYSVLMIPKSVSF